MVVYLLQTCDQLLQIAYILGTTRLFSFHLRLLALAATNVMCLRPVPGNRQGFCGVNTGFVCSLVLAAAGTF